MEKKTQERISLGTLIEALEWCVKHDDNDTFDCAGCPIFNHMQTCVDIIRNNSLVYLKILQEKCDADNQQLLLKVQDRDEKKTVITETAIMPYQKPAPAPEAPKASPLPSHWIWTDEGVINPDNVLYMELDGSRTKIRMVDSKTFLDGDPFGLSQRTKPRGKPKDLEDD